MKYLSVLIFLTVMSLPSCQTHQNLIFNGDTITVSSPKQNISPQGDTVTLDGEYTGIMYAYDGVLVFESDKHREGRLYLYDSETGRRISAIGKTGNAPDEFASLLFCGGFEKKSNEIHLWVNDYYRNNMMLVNTQGEAVKSINTSEFKSANPYGIGAFYVLNDSLLIAYVQPYERFENEIISPSWHVFNYKTGKTIKKIKSYSNYESSGEKGQLSASYLLGSYGAIKPDKSKLAQAMFYLKRADIIDFKSGGSKSIATKDAPNLDLITSGGAMKEHYRNLQCDDRYIYVLENNGKQTSGTINVFDWNGKFVRILQINDDAFNFAFDPVRKILYSKTDAEEIMAYDLNYLYK